MKDHIDDILSQNNPTPKRPLKANFTQTIRAEVVAERPNMWQRLHAYLPTALFTKAGAAAMASFVLVSGSVAAVALWPTPDVQPTLRKQLPSGNRIVGYDISNCSYTDGETPTPNNKKRYYEVRAGSTLTDQQLQDSLRALCEEDLSNNAISAIMKQIPKDTPGVFSTMAYTIDAITADSITITPDPQYDRSTYNTKSGLTYTKFSKDLVLRNQNSTAAFGDFKAGDTVKMIMQDASGKTTEGPGKLYVPSNHPENITILAMVKIPALTADPTTFFLSVGSDMVRLEPCDSDTGFCRAYEFDQ